MSFATKVIVSIISVGLSAGVAQSQIFSKDKLDRGVISGNRNDRDFDLVFDGSLQMRDIQISTYSIKADFLIENYRCYGCRFPAMSSVLLKTEDPDLPQKLALVKKKQYDDFGELIHLEKSTIEIFTPYQHRIFNIDCWAETKYFTSAKLNKNVYGFALSCDGIIGAVRVWGDTYFNP